MDCNRFEARSEGFSAAIGGLESPPPKKARIGSVLVGDVKKAAEIVLVLAAMGRMRGGRDPTAAEMQMMVDAREKLVLVCGEFTPKDVFPREVFGSVIDDLGLGKLREQRLGFRGPKMSIAEKILLTKQKRLQTNLDAAADSRSASHFTRTIPLNKPNPFGGFQPASSLGHVSVANSTPLPYQLPASELRASRVSNGLPTSLLGRDSSSSTLPRVERPHFSLDPIPNGSSYALKNQATSSGDATVLKTPAWSQHSQSTSSGKTGPDDKVLPHPSAKMEGTVKVEGTANITTSRMAPQAAMSKTFITQTTSGHLATMSRHVQGNNFVQSPLVSNVHGEIGKIVQKLLQPKHQEHPTWTPPPRDYMNKALNCHVCNLTIIEVEDVLVCDACEKGYHLKCLQSHNQKAIPKGEWHCFKCLSLSNGKPLPPKYGCVTRNKNTPNMPSNTASIQSSPEKKVGTLGEKGNQQKITANGSSGLSSAPAGSMVNNHNPSASGSNMPKAIYMQGNDILSIRENMDDKCHVQICPNDAIRTSRTACVSSSADSSVERSCKEKLVVKGWSPAKPFDTVGKTLDHLQASSNSQDNDQKGLSYSAGIPPKQSHDNNLTVKDSERSDCSKIFYGNGNGDTKQEEPGVARPEPVETSGTGILASEHVRSSSDCSDDVDWIGDIIQVLNGKTHYSSCCINRIVYKVKDYALFHFNNDKLIPSRLQAMWEDNKTRSKWVIVNQCYFPGDMPQTAGHPCSPDSNEVYESNHGITIMASLIRGPCEVLPLGKFVKESERRSHLGSKANDRLWPLFLCKWIYDESKNVFRDVSS
ncbi:PHD finger protein [Actinidia chinensis var. chinensis]|uniref:PHD finger protein n=1 Tax=Actinidia chinensis var. chinensis TaxID=1590841 RepID=A0A2R6P4S5_ACTCC|nr:PHD finger protein [Actinidia chinensis var. chinensis]